MSQTSFWRRHYAQTQQRPSFFASIPQNDRKRVHKHGVLKGEVEVNVEECHATRQLFKNSAVVKQAITMVSDTLIKDGITININGKSVKLSAKVSRYIQNVFVPLVIEGLPVIMATGLLPIGFRRKQRTTRVNPLNEMVKELMEEEEEKRRKKSSSAKKQEEKSGGSVRTTGGGGNAAPYRYEDSESDEDEPDESDGEDAGFGEIDETWESVKLMEYALGNTTPDVMPYVPEYGTYTITKLTRRSETFFLFKWLPTSISGGVNDEPEWDPEVQVYKLAGYGPDVDGTLNSILRTLLRKFMRLEQIWECTVKAEAVGCDPPVFTQYKDEENDRNAPPDDKKDEECDPNREGGGFIWMAPLDKTEVREDRKIHLSEQHQKLLWAQKKAYDNRATASILMGRGDAATKWRLLNAVDNHLPLPINRVLVRQQMPQLATNVLDADNEFKKEAFMIIGVPQSAAMESGVSVRGNYEAMAATMRNTVIKWKRSWRTILTDIYLRMTMGRFSDKIIDFETKKRTKANGGDEDKALKSVMADLPKLADSSKVTVELAVAPEMTLSTLEYLYLNGIIDYGKYQELAALMTNLNHTDIKQGGDPFSKEERKMMLLKTSGQQQQQQGSSSSSSSSPKQTKEESNKPNNKKRKEASSSGGGESDKKEVGTGNTTAANKRSNLPKKSNVSLGEEKK